MAPLSSTGVQMRSGGPERPRLGLGWIQGTTRTADRAWVLLALASMWPGAVVKVRDRGVQWYDRSATVGARGVLVAWEPKSSSSSPAEVFIQIPQGALDALGWEGQVRLASVLADLGLRASRVDVYWDDLARIADPEAEVLASMVRRDTLSRVKKWKRIGDSDGGATAYIGSRQAECMIRVYRKWIESGDDRDGVRWELEAKGERAVLVLALMVGSRAPADTFWTLLRAFVDFRDRSGHVRGDEAPMLAWWSALVQSAGRARLVMPVHSHPLAATFAWLRRAVAPSLALGFALGGSAFVDELIRTGWDRAAWERIEGAA